MRSLDIGAATGTARTEDGIDAACDGVEAAGKRSVQQGPATLIGMRCPIPYRLNTQADAEDRATGK